MGTTGQAEPKNGFTRRTQAIAAAVVLVVPILSGAFINIMIERNHAELVRLHCTGTSNGAERFIPDRAEPPAP